MRLTMLSLKKTSSHASGGWVLGLKGEQGKPEEIQRKSENYFWVGRVGLLSSSRFKLLLRLIL